MNKQAKLQPSQLTMILTLSAAFSVMCAAFPFTLEQLIGTAISIGLQILLCIPAFLLTRRTDSLAAHCKEHKFLPLFFCYYLLLAGGRSVVQLWSVSGSLSLPDYRNLFLYVYDGHSDACTQQHADFWRSPAHAGSHALRRIPFHSPAKPRLFAG